MPQGVSYVRHEHEPANPYIRKHNTHQSTSGPLPCTIEAITRSGTDIPSSRPTGPFSPNVVEKEFFLLTYALATPLWVIGFFVEVPGLPKNSHITDFGLAFCPLIAASILVYREAGGGGVRSLFAVIVFHAMSNVSSAFISTVAGIPLIAITVVIVTFLWGSKTLARYRYA